MDYHASDEPSKCLWTPDGANPHIRRNKFNNRKKPLSNILEAIGQTPLIKLNKIPLKYGIQCEIYVKCEYLNPGGSVKDRIGYRMVQDAEEKGWIKPGSTIIEPTSGNTGIGLAMAAAVKGYRCIIVMPQKMSNEKLYTLELLGAEIIRTPTEAAWNSPEGHICVAEKLRDEIPNSIILNQYINPGNPLAHYDQTAEEIWEQMDGKLDYFVGGAGTGGTITGIGRRLRELYPEIKIVAIDPVGSILAEPFELNDTKKTFYDVEGVGYDFIPTVLDRSVIDEWIKCDDKESFNMARELSKEEGLLCGGSSGAAVISAIKLAKNLPADKKIVILLPDGIRNYMTKFVSDHWMIARGYMEPPCPTGCESWWNLPVSKLNLIKIESQSKKSLCIDIMKMMKKQKFDVIPIAENEKFIGYVTLSIIQSRLLNRKIKQDDEIDKLIIKQFFLIPCLTNLGKVSTLLEKEEYLFIVDKYNDKYLGIVTPQVLYDFV